MKQPKVITLKNGLKIVLSPQEGAPTATALVLVRAGSEYETEKEAGISHFLEHLAFKGSGKYPNPGQISHELESLGAESNAWTSENNTAYWAKVQSGKAQRILEIISELHLDPLIDPVEVDKERGVIIEEIAMYEDQPRSKVGELWQSLLYGTQPAGRPIAGTKESVRKITRDEVVQYRDRRYRAPETVVSFAGGFDPKAAEKFIKARFGSLDERAATKKSKTREVQSAPGIKLEAKKSDQAHIIMGFRGLKIGDPREHTLGLLATVLGGGMSSRLFMRIREELGAAYYVHAWSDASSDHGALGVSVGANISKVDAVVKAVLEEYQRLTTELVSPKELKRARDYQIGGFLMGQESSDAIAAHHGLNLLLRGKVVPVSETVAAIRAVTAEDIRRIARKIIREETLNLAAIGPNLKEAHFRKLLRLE